MIVSSRREQGALAALAVDGVAGLRVLRGVRGERVYLSRYRDQARRVREAGIRAARPGALLISVRNAGPAFFTAVTVCGGLWLVYRGALTSGELVAFYGLTGFLTVPINLAANAIGLGVGAWVGAKRLTDLAGAASLIDETIGQFDTVEALGMGRTRFERLDTLIREHWRIERYVAWTRWHLLLALHLAAAVPVLAAAGWGAFLVGEDWATPGTAVTIVLYAYELRDPVRRLAQWTEEFQVATVSFARIFGVEEAAGSREGGGLGAGD